MMINSCKIVWAKPIVVFLLSLLLAANTACSAQVSDNHMPTVAAARMDAYLPLLSGKRVALLINQTSRVGESSLLDTLLARGVHVVKVFVPEHGFRGQADAGAKVNNELDQRTGLPLVSLYGNNKKPSNAQMADIDVLVYDLQDVGLRFYTYISSLEYAMDACIENKKLLLVLDRPNPNGHLVDGPVLDTNLRSFVGMQPIPILYGMTAGEYALMLKGEAWIKHAQQLQLKVIPCSDYTHHSNYNLPVAPSPNLRTMTAVYLYASLCLFEGTVVSVGRGTDMPFQQWGHPSFAAKSNYYFVPQRVGGASKPLYEGQRCYGMLVSDEPDKARALTQERLHLAFLLQAYQWSGMKDQFFNSFFEKLAGTTKLRQQIIAGVSEAEIRASWQPELTKFKAIRSKYLLYPL